MKVFIWVVGLLILAACADDISISQYCPQGTFLTTAGACQATGDDHEKTN